MSSRFVSAGVVDASGDVVEAAKDAKEKTVAEKAELAARQAEWAAVERRLEDERTKREAARTAAPSSSLYDMLQANKDAKQAAFEEAAKLSNQFRALDEDEIAFLDALKASQRAEAARVQRETAEGIEAFRKAQTSTGAVAAETAVPDEGDVSWSIRKRKRTERTGFPKLKRRADDAAEKKDEAPEATTATAAKTAKAEKPEETDAKPAAAKPPSKPSLLVAYGSDSDSE